MKHILSVLLCALFFAVPAMAQKGGAAPKKTGPQFSFKGGDTHDFGKVQKGPIVHYTFEFTNTGKEPLIIQDVNPSCGCTNAEWDKQPILPGKKGHIKVGLRTAEQHGVFAKQVYVKSNAINAGADGRYTLNITGTALENEAAKEPAQAPKKL